LSQALDLSKKSERSLIPSHGPIKPGMSPQDGVLGSGGSRIGMWARLWAHSCLRMERNWNQGRLHGAGHDLCSIVQGRPVDRRGWLLGEFTWVRAICFEIPTFFLVWHLHMLRITPYVTHSDFIVTHTSCRRVFDRFSGLLVMINIKFSLVPCMHVGLLSMQNINHNRWGQEDSRRQRSACFIENLDSYSSL